MSMTLLIEEHVSDIIKTKENIQNRQALINFICLKLKRKLILSQKNSKTMSSNEIAFITKLIESAKTSKELTAAADHWLDQQQLFNTTEIQKEYM